MVYTAALLFGPGLDDWGVGEMIGNFIRSARRGSVESCDERDSTVPSVDQEAGVASDECLQEQEVTRHIERCLTEAKSSALQCQVLLLPRRLTSRVGQDVVRSSLDEPCGIRGASIKVYVEGERGLVEAGGFLPHPGVTPTFELSLVFSADRDAGWTPLRHIFPSSKALKLRADYRLVKRKLYSSASPVECHFR